jgi:hypothetical protein
MVQSRIGALINVSSAIQTKPLPFIQRDGWAYSGNARRRYHLFSMAGLIAASSLTKIVMS